MITAFVPTLNNEKTIRDVLKAIKNQTVKPKRIIVIDSGSNDDTEKIVREEGCEFYSPQDFGLEFLGLSRARNRILELIDTPYLLSVDSDIILEKNHIEKLLPVLQNDKTIAGVAAKQIEFNRLTLGDKARAVIEMRDLDIPLKDQSGRFQNFLLGSNNIYKVEILKEVGEKYNNNPYRPFDEELTTNYEDALLGERITNLGYKLYWTPEILTYHLQKDDVKSFVNRAYRYRVFKWKLKGAFKDYNIYKGKIEHNINYTLMGFDYVSKKAKAELSYPVYLIGFNFFLEDILFFMEAGNVQYASRIYNTFYKSLKFMDNELKEYILKDNQYILNKLNFKVSDDIDKDIFEWFKKLAKGDVLPKKFPSIYDDFNKDVKNKLDVIKASKNREIKENELKIYDDFKVLLVNLPWIDGIRRGVRSGSRWPHTYETDKIIPRYVPFPFFLYYTHNLLQKENVASFVIDAVAEGFNEDETFFSIVGYMPDLLVIETSTPTFEYDLNYAKKIKEFNPDIKICFVGTHISYIKEKILKYGFIDFAIEREFEEEIVKLAKEMKNGSVIQKYRVSNGVNFEKFEIIREISPFYNYNDRPVSKLKYPSLQIQLTRGCPFKCTFCMWPQVLFNKNYQKKDLDIVIEDIKKSKEIFKINSFYIDDDTFNIDKTYIRSFAEKLIENDINLPFMAMARADCVVDEETLKMLKEAGLVALKFGIESVDEGFLKDVNKDLDIKKAEEAITLCKKLDIEVHLTFSIGSFKDTLEGIKKSFLWLVSQNPNSMQISILTPFPGTKMWDIAVKRGFKLDEDFSKYDGARYSVVSSNVSAEKLQEIKKNWIKEWHNFKKTGQYSLEFLK